MQNCPYNNTCTKRTCDLACRKFAEFEHWSRRCGFSVKNAVIRASIKELEQADNVLQASMHDEDNYNSNYRHISVCKDAKSQYAADLISYVAICKYCKDIGFYHGVYKLNFSQYLETVKASWNSREPLQELEDMKMWIASAKYLIIYNMGLVRFGDFESQTLLTIFQERYADNNYTILVLEKGDYSLPGKVDSLFYKKLKSEITSRGVSV